MTRIRTAVAALALMMGGAMVAPSQNTPPANPGNGPVQKQQKGGKKIGPRDGSGPIHTPGAGGGNGGGHRRGRR